MTNEEFERLLEVQASRLEPSTARVHFKSWPVHTQRKFLEGLLSEHAYACGFFAEPFEVRGVVKATYEDDLNEGLEHRMDKNRGVEI